MGHPAPFLFAHHKQIGFVVGRGHLGHRVSRAPARYHVFGLFKFFAAVGRASRDRTWLTAGFAGSQTVSCLCANILKIRARADAHNVMFAALALEKGGLPARVAI